MNPEAAYRQISELVATMPNLHETQAGNARPLDTHRWLGRLHALLEAMNRSGEVISLSLEIGRLQTIFEVQAEEAIRNIAYRTLAAAELAAPSSIQGSFIPAGHGFDAYTALSKVLGRGKTGVLIIDPYMDAVTATDFVPSVPDGISVRLLADSQFAKPTLKPAVSRYSNQHGTARPLHAKVAPARALHDRLILVDGLEAWILTQSLKDFAARAPGSIARVDDQTAALKIQAYEGIWKSSPDL